MVERERHHRGPDQRDILRRLDYSFRGEGEIFHLSGQDVVLLLSSCDVQITDETREKLSDPDLSRVYIDGGTLKKAIRSRRLTGMAKAIATQLSGSNLDQGILDEGPINALAYGKEG